MFVVGPRFLNITITKYKVYYYSKYYIVTQGIFNPRHILITIHHGVGIGLG